MRKPEKSAYTLLSKAGTLIRASWLKLVDIEFENAIDNLYPKLTPDQIEQISNAVGKLLALEHPIRDILTQIKTEQVVK